MSEDGIDYRTAAKRVRIVGTRFFASASVEAVLPAAMLDAPHDVRISLEYDPVAVDWRVTEFGAILRPDGDPITTESMRELAVGLAVRAVTHAAPGLVVDAGDVDYYTVWDRERATNAEQRKTGPSPENLAIVGEQYRLSRLLRDSPMLAVAGSFNIPERTASHWIMLARERGHLNEPGETD